MNPERAVDAILAGPKQIDGVTVYPLTLARIACLERVGSPILTGRGDGLNSVYSAWIMTRPVEELAAVASDRGEMEKRALIWAEGFPVDSFSRICVAIVEQFKALSGVAPGADDDDKKKALTAG